MRGGGVKRGEGGAGGRKPRKGREREEEGGVVLGAPAKHFLQTNVSVLSHKPAQNKGVFAEIHRKP